MNLIAGVLALLPVWLLGASLIGLAGLRRDDGTDAALAWAAGVAALAVLGSALVASGVRLSPLYLWVLIVAALAAAVLRRALPRVRPIVPQTTLARVLVGAAALVLLLLVAASFQDRLSWDGFAFWTLKARMLFDDGLLPADSFARPGPFDYAHADYPLALPLVDWWQFEHAGAPLPALASVGGALWFVLVVWLFWSASARRAGSEQYAALATLGLAVFWPIWYFATGGTADVLMVLAVLGATIELERFAREPAPAPLLRVVVYLTLAALAKNEGLALALVGCAVVAAVALRRLPRAQAVRVGALSLVPVLLAGAWRAWTAAQGADVEQLGSAYDPATLTGNALLVARGLFDLATYRQWPPLLFVIAIGVWRWRRHRLSEQSAAWTLLGVYLALALGVYLTTEQDLAWLLDTSLGRVVSALVPAALFLTLTGVPRDERQPVVAQTHEPVATAGGAR